MTDPAPLPGQLTFDNVDHRRDPAGQGAGQKAPAAGAPSATDALAKFRERQRDRLRARGGMG